MARVYQRRAGAPDARPRPGRAAHLPPARREARRASRTGRRYARTVLVFSAVFWRRALRDPAHAGHPPVQPARTSTRRRGTSPSTPTSSFVTNTNWQFYGGETTLSYFSQMAGLAVQNFVSAAVGMAVLARVIRGFARAQRDELGNFWRRPHAHAALHPAAALVRRRAVPRLPGRGPDASTATSTSTTIAGGEQTLALGPGRLADRDQAARHQRRRLLQRQLAMPFENPTQFSNFVEMLFILLIPAALTVHVRPHGRQPPPGLGDLRRDVALFVVGVWSSTRPSSTARRQHAAGLATPADGIDRRQPPGQGAALRHRQPRSGPPSRPWPPTARSTRRTSRSRASAAPCRWST